MHIHLFCHIYLHLFERGVFLSTVGTFAFRMNCRHSYLGVSRAPSGCIFGVANLFGYCRGSLSRLLKLPYWSCEIFLLFLFHIGHFGVVGG
jgi:hypothetical protein